MSAINISKNLVLHFKTKDIAVCYHFIKEVVEKDIITFEYIPTET